MAEAFPPELLRPGVVDEVISLLRDLPINPKAKKYTLYEWCKTAGVDLTVEMVEQVTGLRAGEI